MTLTRKWKERQSINNPWVLGNKGKNTLKNLHRKRNKCLCYSRDRKRMLCKLDKGCCNRILMFKCANRRARVGVVMILYSHRTFTDNRRNDIVISHVKQDYQQDMYSLSLDCFFLFSYSLHNVRCLQSVAIYSLKTRP